MSDPQPMTAFEMMLAQWREMAKAENVACGLKPEPVLPTLAPKPTGRRPTGVVVLRDLDDGRNRTREQERIALARRRQVIRLLADGYTTREIAECLGESVRLITDDCIRMRKMGVIA